MILECFYFKNGTVIRAVCKSKWKSMVSVISNVSVLSQSGFDAEMQFNIYTYKRKSFRKPWKIIQSMLVVCDSEVCLNKI